MGILGTP